MITNPMSFPLLHYLSRPLKSKLACAHLLVWMKRSYIVFKHSFIKLPDCFLMWGKKKIHNLSEILGIAVGRIMAAPKMSLKPVDMFLSWHRGIKVANWLT